MPCLRLAAVLPLLFLVSNGLGREPVGAHDLGLKKIPSALAGAEELLDRSWQGLRTRYRWARSLPWKEATDNTLLPIFLLREIGSRQPILLCRSLTYPYEGLSRPTIAGSARGAAMAKSALKRMRLSSHRYVRFKIIAANLFTVGTSYPVLLCWRGAVNSRGGVARVCWYEPILSNQSIAFPDAENNCGLRWNRRRAVDETHYGYGFSPPYTTQFRAGGPLLDLGYGVYALSNSTALWPVIRLRPKLVPLASHDSAGPVRLAGPLNWRGGRGRREIFNFDGGMLRGLEIIQPPVPLTEYLSVGPSSISYTSHGKLLHAKFWPHVSRRYLKTGRTISVRFHVRPGTPLTGLPSTVVINRQSARRFYARFCSLRYIHGALPDTPWHLSRRLPVRLPARGGGGGRSAFAPPRITPGWRIRERFRRRVLGLLRERDWSAMGKMLAGYAAFLKSERVPYRFYVYDVEILACDACSYDDTGRVSAVVRRFLMPSYRGLRPEEIARRVAQCVDQYRYGLAVVAADVLGADPAAGRRLRAWAGRVSAKLTALVSKIKADPGPYRRYAHANRMYRWRRLTKQNELITAALKRKAVLGSLRK